MRVEPDQIAAALERGLAPVYLVAGDEALLVNEACDAIRAAARQQGYGEREVFTVETGFDWSVLTTAGQSLSLFAERRVLDLRLSGGRPGEAGAAALEAWAAAPPPDTLLLVSAGKLDKTLRDSAWVRAIESRGVLALAWPVDAAKLPGWIAQRLRLRQLQAEPGVVEQLAYSTEGNLLATAQEIDKLAMLLGPEGLVRLEDVVQTLGDSARFNIFGLIDTCLAGDAATGARMLRSLRAEGVEPVLLLWALARELRSLGQMAGELARGGSESAVLGRVWAQRRPLVQRALRRWRAPQWQALTARAARTDRVIKGRADGDAWQELEVLSLALCGVRPPAAAPER